MYVFGGEQIGGSLSNRIHQLNLSSYVWSSIDSTGETPPGLTRHSCGFLKSSQSLFVFGGKTKLHSPSYSSSMYVIKLDGEDKNLPHYF